MYLVHFQSHLVNVNLFELENISVSFQIHCKYKGKQRLYIIIITNFMYVTNGNVQKLITKLTILWSYDLFS